MKANAGARLNLRQAYLAGDKRAFVASVSHLGIRATAYAIVDCLIEQKGSVESLAAQSVALLKTSNFRGIPRAEDFIHFMLTALSASEANEQEKHGILVLFLAEVDLASVKMAALSGLGGPALRLLVETLPTVPNALEIATIAIGNRDRALLDLIKPQLSSDDIFSLWEDLQFTYFQPRVGLLLGSGLYPKTKAQRNLILERVIHHQADQAVLMKLLAEAWPADIATFKIPSSLPSPGSYWMGETLEFLLDRWDCLDRENWMSVFSFHNSSIFREQVEAVGGVANNPIAWNHPNQAGSSFMLEVYTAMASFVPSKRLPILATLLEAGADPRRMLAEKARIGLKSEEVSLMMPFATQWDAKDAKLAPTPEIQPLETDLDLE